MTTTELAADQAEPLRLTRDEWLTLFNALDLAADALVDDVQTLDRLGFSERTAALISASHAAGISEMYRLQDRIDRFIDTIAD